MNKRRRWKAKRRRTDKRLVRRFLQVAVVASRKLSTDAVTFGDRTQWPERAARRLAREQPRLLEAVQRVGLGGPQW
jgi:hypothetical protein